LSALSTLFAFFFSLAALASRLRIVSGEALDYDIFLEDPSTSRVLLNFDLLCVATDAAGHFVFSEALNSIPKKSSPATQRFFFLAARFRISAAPSQRRPRL
jgi:hypothetical protein